MNRTPAVAFAVLTLGYVAANAATPHPGASGATVLAYATTHTALMRAGAALLLASAVSLVLTVRRTGRTATAGGLLAALMITLSAIAIAAESATADPGQAHTLASLAFLAGGPGYAAAFGLLAAGCRHLPGGLARTGLALTALGAAALLAPVVPALDYLLPAVRFGGLIWLIAASWPRERRLPLTSGTSARLAP